MNIVIEKREMIINNHYAMDVENCYNSEDPEKFIGTIKRNKEISIKSFCNRLEHIYHTNTINDILPNNCKYFKKLNNRTLYVIEDQPQMRTILVNYDMSIILERLKTSHNLDGFNVEEWKKKNKTPYKFHLLFPYVIYLILLDANSNNLIKLKVFGRMTPITNYADYLFILPLLNISDEQTCCIGNTPTDMGSAISSIRSLKDHFWGSEFNSDYVCNLRSYSDIPYVCDYLTWQYHSQRDPMFLYNVEWISAEKTLGEYIKDLEKEPIRDDHNKFLLLLNRIFYHAIPSNINNNNNPNCDLIDNVTESINIKEFLLFHNDSFKLNNKRYFVETFSSYQNNLSATHIKLRTSNNKIITYSLSEEFKDTLYNAILTERSLFTATIGDITIKKDDIIKYTDRLEHTSYTLVSYLRYGLDGKVEVRINSSFVTIENMKDISIINKDNIVCNGVKLIVNKSYIIIKDNNPTMLPLPIQHYTEMVYKNIEISLQVLRLVFSKGEDPQRISLSFSLEEIEQRIIDQSKYQKLLTGFRVGTSIILDKCNMISDDSKNLLIKYGTTQKESSFNTLMDTLMKDKDHLFIQGIDMDLSFKVGDVVVTSNWSNPVEMMKFKTITGFERTPNCVLNILLEDHYGEKSKHAYIHKDASCLSEIKIGTIRHIEKEYKGVIAGSKIVASKRSIPDFPMKDTNIVVGFLSDTGGDIPIVLCSNGGTIWADDLQENFNVISIDNIKKWKSLQHAPFKGQTKFKLQSGDVVKLPNISSDTFVISRISYSKRLQCMRLGGVALYLQNMLSGVIIKPEMKDHIKRIGFLNPRYSKQQSETLKKTRVYPNFHGMYTSRSNVSIICDLDKRRNSNVPNLCI